MRLPDFLIVGAAKAGTTSLYYYLGQHPEIGFPKLKEPKYFSSKHLVFPHRGVGDVTVDNFAVKTFDDYANLFSGLSAYKRAGEASPDYLYYHELTVPEIQTVLGDVPILIILRNPVDRAFSAYTYLVRDSREKLPFRDALSAEEERLSNNWDFIWGYKKAGLYYEQVKSFLENFSKVKIIFLEEMKKNPHKCLKEIYRILEVNEYFKARVNIEHNPSGVPKNLFAKYLLSRENTGSVFVREVLKKFVPRSILENVAKKSLQRMHISEEDKIYLTDYYSTDIGKLETLIGKYLSFWGKKKRSAALK